MKHAIILLPKSPRPYKGRFGRDQKQNWFHSCLLAVKTAKDNGDAPIIIPSSFKHPDYGELGEAAFYRWYLSRWYSRGRIILCDGNETISQINSGLVVANFDLQQQQVIVHIIWACKEHWKRWDSIGRWINVPNNVSLIHDINVQGRPRPKEFVTDHLLAFVFRYFGERQWNWYFRKVNARREEGKI